MLTQQPKQPIETTSLLPSNVAPSHSTTAAQFAQSRIELNGLLWIGLASVLYAIPSVTVRTAFMYFAFPSTASMVLRCAVQLLISTILLSSIFRVSPPELSPSRCAMLLLRGATGSAALLCLYKALTYLPAGEVVALYSFTPIVTMLLSKLILKETATLWDIACALLGAAGVWIIAGSEASSKQHALGAALVLLGGLFTSVAFICIRLMGTDVHFMLAVFSFGAVGLPMTAIVGGNDAFYHIVTNTEGTAIVLLSSLAGFLAQCCLSKGLQLCNPGVAVIMTNLEIPFVYLLSLWVLNESPSFFKIVGSILVVLAVVMVGIRRLSQI